MSRAVLGAGHTAVKQTRFLPSQSLHSSRGDKKNINKTLVSTLKFIRHCLEHHLSSYFSPGIMVFWVFSFNR